MSILKKQSTRMMITMAMVHLITKTKMSAETIARKTKIRGKVAEGLQYQHRVNSNNVKVFPIEMMMMIPSEENCPGSDEEDEELEGE